MNQDKLTITQRLLLFSLYGLVALMVIFSLMAIRNIGEDGYHRCIQKKCEQRGEAFCNKFREINNCCQGAGGAVGVVKNQYTCEFA